MLTCFVSSLFEIMLLFLQKTVNQSLPNYGEQPATPHVLPSHPGLNGSPRVCSFMGSCPASICHTLCRSGREVLCPTEGRGLMLPELGTQSQAQTGACPVDRGAWEGGQAVPCRLLLL